LFYAEWRGKFNSVCERKEGRKLRYEWDSEKEERGKG
jgi:hypothetical protein